MILVDSDNKVLFELDQDKVKQVNQKLSDEGF